MDRGLSERPRDSLFSFFYIFLQTHAIHPRLACFPLLFPFWLFVIYLKIEQAHSGFHKGDQSNGFRQWPSFQAALKPVNKLNTRGRSGVKSLENVMHDSLADLRLLQMQNNEASKTITVNELVLCAAADATTLEMALLFSDTFLTLPPTPHPVFFH